MTVPRREVPCGTCPAVLSAEDVSLNPVTAYPFLILSDDRKQVKRGEKLQFFRNSQQRFDVWSCVLAKEGFGSGRHYWEVRPGRGSGSGSGSAAEACPLTCAGVCWRQQGLEGGRGHRGGPEEGPVRHDARQRILRPLVERQPPAGADHAPSDQGPNTTQLAND